MLKLLRYLKPYKWPAFFVILMTTVQSLCQLYLPTLMSDIVNRGVVGKSVTLIINTGLTMLGFSLIVAVCTIMVRLFAIKTAAGFARDIRHDVFRTVESYSLNEFDKIPTASLITRSTNDITQVQNAMMMVLTMLVSAPIMCAGGIIMALGKNAGLSWLIALLIFLLSALVLIIAIKVMPLFKSLQKKIDKINLILRERLTGIRVIRAFNKTEYEQKRFSDANKDLTDTSILAFRWMGALMPSILMFLNFATVAVIWFGGIKVSQGDMQVGDLMAFQQYVMQVMFAVIMATMMIVMLPRASASALRIVEVLGQKPTVLDITDKAPAAAKHGSVEFKNVSFYYDGALAPALSNINLKAQPGQITAIIGGTGAGKSTLIKLIPRFYDVSEGCVLVNGVDVKDYPKADLRKKIGYVPQKASLVSGSVADNLRFGRTEANDEELITALKTAQAYDFVSELEGGLYAKVSQDGSNFSGGQKQRLSIARALVRRPQIYIFDDSFSALDYRTDLLLRQALLRQIKHASVFIVAQRVSTVMNADNIIVLDQGQIIGQGRHDLLMKSCKTYREIVESQLNSEEMA